MNSLKKKQRMPLFDKTRVLTDKDTKKLLVKNDSKNNNTKILI